MSTPVPSSTLAPQGYVAITPSDTVPILGIQWLRVGTAGNLTLANITGAGSVTLAVTAGEYIPFGNGFVMNTGTNATGIVAFI